MVKKKKRNKKEVGAGRSGRSQKGVGASGSSKSNVDIKEKNLSKHKKNNKKFKNKKEKIMNKSKKNNSNQSVVKDIERVEKELEKVVVGQKKVIRGVMRAILCEGHVLVEGVPGLAKTLIIRSIAHVMGCEMKRIQFTVDLLPTDITGINSYNPKKGFQIMKGPIFANFVIADEINRSPPKTQSALLEAMQEREVTISKESYELPRPFFVMATQNPIETSGVYTLPEAQVDRFIFKLVIEYPKPSEEQGILSQNMTIKNFEDYNLKKILCASRIIQMQKKVKEIYTSEEIKDYIVRIVNKTRNKDFEYAKYVSYGASPRASIYLYLASKAEALMKGRDFVLPEDVKEVAYPILRHRIILNYEAEADKITTDDIIKHLLKNVRAP